MNFNCLKIRPQIVAESTASLVQFGVFFLVPFLVRSSM